MSIITKCLDCKMSGCNMPENTICGNCGSNNTFTYMSANEIIYIRTLLEKLSEAYLQPTVIIQDKEDWMNKLC